jgi:hypothetical protein
MVKFETGRKLPLSMTECGIAGGYVWEQSPQPSNHLIIMRLVFSPSSPGSLRDESEKKGGEYRGPLHDPKLVGRYRMMIPGNDGKIGVDGLL